jgi:hypothetical protein
MLEVNERYVITGSDVTNVRWYKSKKAPSRSLLLLKRKVLMPKNVFFLPYKDQW